MSTEPKPFHHPHPLKLADRSEFFGWPKQILFELRVLLRQRDAEWLNSVARQLHQALQIEDGSQRQYLQVPLEPDLLRLDEMPFAFESERPGNIGLFTAVEPTLRWSEMTPRTKRWERYAVFALLNIRDAIELLETLLPEEEQLDQDGSLAMLTYSRAGGFALEAMRSLQIAHSLRIDAHSKSERGRKAATARHLVFVSTREEAIRMANSRPFETKEQALDYITSNLLIDSEKNLFCSRSAAAKWLLKAGWQAKTKSLKS